MNQSIWLRVDVGEKKRQRGKKKRKQEKERDDCEQSEPAKQEVDL